MEFSIISYIDEVRDRLEQLSSEKRLFFAVWCTEKLHSKYVQPLNIIDYNTFSKSLEQVLESLKSFFLKEESIGESQLSEVRETLENITLDDTQDDPSLVYGVSQYLDSLYLSISVCEVGSSD